MIHSEKTKEGYQVQIYGTGKTVAEELAMLLGAVTKADTEEDHTGMDMLEEALRMARKLHEDGIL